MTTDFRTLWTERYGSEPTFDIPELAPFLSHQSVRKFSDKPVTEETISALIAAAQSAATSSHLQLWSIISVHDSEKRARLQEIGKYPYIKDAPWFFTFLCDTYRDAKLPGAGTGIDYTEFLLTAVVDVALAAERMVCAAESLGLGACYIGAMRNDPEGVAKILELPEGVFCPFGLCIGWPDEAEQTTVKPRLSQDAIWFRDTYDSTSRTDEFDARMAKDYESRGQSSEVTWSQRTARRTDEGSMTGREVWKAWLESIGLGRR